MTSQEFARRILRSRLAPGFALIALVAATLTPERPALSSELPYMCTHNGDLYAVVYGTQPCPPFVHDPGSADKTHDPNDPDCIIGRLPDLDTREWHTIDV